MMVKKVWIFIAVAVLLATVVTSKQHPGVGSSQGDLIGANNRSEFSGNWKLNPLKDKWHSKTPSRTGFQLFLHEGSQDVSKRSALEVPEEEFPLTIERLYTDDLSLKILGLTILTKFFKGVRIGLLPFDTYREYLAQEAIFLNHAARLCDRGFERMKIGVGQEQNEIFASFFWNRHKYFSEQLKLFSRVKKVNRKSQEVSEALKVYMGSLESVIAEDKDPKFLPVAFLHRDWLYGKLADAEFIDIDINVYKNECKNMYLRQKGLTSTEKFFDETYDGRHQEAYLNIFHHNALKALNYFRAFFKELPLTMEEVISKKV